MAVGHDDRGRTRAFTEPFRGGLPDQCAAAENTGVDENPAAIAGAGRTEVHDVDDRVSLVGEVGRDLMDVVVVVFSGAGGVVYGNLMTHTSTPLGGPIDSCGIHAAALYTGAAQEHDHAPKEPVTTEEPC